MIRAFFVVVASFWLLSSCTQKVVCPAYQSAFIYDKQELQKKYSYFNEEGEPKVLASASKNKYLVAEPTTYKRKNRSLQTVVMKPVNPVVPDSLLMDDLALAGDLDRAARSVIDSTYIVDPEPRDSAEVTEKKYVISVDREVRVLKHSYPDSIQYDSVSKRYDRFYVPGVPVKPSYHVKEIGFNVEQDNYMWYLRDVLVLPDVRLAKEIGEQKKAAKTEKKEKKRIKGFFGGLFKKKDKKTDEAALDQQKVSADMDEYNFDEFDDVPRDSASTTKPAPAAKKKKGITLFQKKDKPAKQKAEPKSKKADTPPAKKEEDEDDGFGF
ncbi:MAG: hypothetical protein KF846_04935 [Cyclobacteriaceae bacterium]|nr:hypothetical protein [Cyclobacteriaceae bacterium]